MTHIRLSTALLMATLLVSASISGTASAAASASVHQSTVTLDRPFVLQLESDDGASSIQPDLTSLSADFDILGTSTQSSVTVINGKVSSTQGWSVSLLPKHTGKVVIPALQIGKDKTRALALNVVKSKPASHAGSQQSAPPASRPEVTLSVPSGPYYPQQTIPVTVRLSGIDQLTQAELLIDDVPNVSIESGGDDTTKQVVVDGRTRTVIERHLLVKPQQAGKVTIPPITLQGTQPSHRNSSRARDLFDMLNHSDPFSVDMNSMFDGFFDRGQSVVVRSKPLTLDVQPRPASVTGWFLPAKDVKISAEWSPATPHFKVGEAVTRTIKVTALGASPEQLPALHFDSQNGITVYTDRSDRKLVDTPDGPAAVAEVTLSIIPTESGDLTLPAVQVPWWDTQSKTSRLAKLPVTSLHVSGKVPASASPSMPAQVDSQLSENQATGAKAPSGIDMAVLRKPVWLAVGGGVVLLLLLTSYILWRRKSAPINPEPDAQLHASSPRTVNPAGDGHAQAKAQAKADAALLAACAANLGPQAYQALQAALRLQTKTMELPKELLQAQRELENLLFSGNVDHSTWQGKALADAYKSYLKQRRHSTLGKTRDSQTLPDLYPQVGH